MCLLYLPAKSPAGALPSSVWTRVSFWCGDPPAWDRTVLVVSVHESSVLSSCVYTDTPLFFFVFERCLYLVHNSRWTVFALSILTISVCCHLACLVSAEKPCHPHLCPLSPHRVCSLASFSEARFICVQAIKTRGGGHWLTGIAMDSEEINKLQNWYNIVINKKLEIFIGAMVPAASR